jgi:hypothetical protein
MDSIFCIREITLLEANTFTLKGFIFPVEVQ